MGYWESNTGHLCAREMLYLLRYHSGPSFTNFFIRGILQQIKEIQDINSLTLFLKVTVSSSYFHWVSINVGIIQYLFVIVC